MKKLLIKLLKPDYVDDEGMVFETDESKARVKFIWSMFFSSIFLVSMVFVLLFIWLNK